MACCPKCKTELTDGTTRCPICNTELDTSFENERDIETTDYSDGILTDANGEEDSSGTFSASYTRLSDKYEDVKSSSYTLLIVGIAGLAAMLMETLGIFNLPISPQTHWLFYTVMGGVFIVFIIAGIISAMHAKQLKIDAAVEDKTVEDILSWFKDNYTKELIDASIDTDVQDELLYFNRADFIKDTIMHQFETADEALVESLIETIYQELFESI